MSRVAGSRLSVPTVMRPADEKGRTSTPLELLFDLCFVVAVALLAAELHHALAENHPVSGALTYAGLFIPLWWAWMSHTWYSTAFSHDDVPNRVLTLLQMAGVLAVAAAVPLAFQGDLVPFTVAYTLMRMPLLGQWLRAARDDVAHRRFAIRYAVGTVVAQLVWLLALAGPYPWRWGVLGAALAIELLTPPWAVRAAPGRVSHPGHISERYGLFALIVIGETILAVTMSIRDALAGDQGWTGPVLIGAGGLALAFALWWLYFDTVGSEGLTRNRTAAFAWGYGHFALYAALAAIGAGVQAQLELSSSGENSLAAASVGIPVAVAVLAIAFLQRTANHRVGSARAQVVAAMVVLGVTLTVGSRVPSNANLLLASVVVVLLVRELRAPPASP